MAAKQQECSICMDSFKNPKLIPCHHSFCYKCLEDYVRANIQNGQFNCPLCRKSAKLPKEGVSGFQTNFYIEATSEERFTCDLCDHKSVACVRCLDCEENLCQSCCRAHEKSKATKHHKIMNLGTLDPEMKGKIRQRIFCDKHPEEEIKLVCQKCQMLICVLCKAIDHENHASKSVADAVKEASENLNVKVNKCTERLTRLKVTAQKAQESERKINEQEIKAIASIEQHRLKAIEAFNKEVSKMKDRVKRSYLRERNKNFMSDVEHEIKLCSYGIENATKLKNQGTLTEIITKREALEQKLSEVSSRNDPSYEIQLVEPLFAPSEITSSGLTALIGTIQDKDCESDYEDPNGEIIRSGENEKCYKYCYKCYCKYCYKYCYKCYCKYCCYCCYCKCRCKNCRYYNRQALFCVQCGHPF